MLTLTAISLIIWEYLHFHCKFHLLAENLEVLYRELWGHHPSRFPAFRLKAPSLSTDIFYYIINCVRGSGPPTQQGIKCIIISYSLRGGIGSPNPKRNTQNLGPAPSITQLPLEGLEWMVDIFQLDPYPKMELNIRRVHQVGGRGWEIGVGEGGLWHGFHGEKGGLEAAAQTDGDRHCPDLLCWPSRLRDPICAPEKKGYEQNSQNL